MRLKFNWIMPFLFAFILFAFAFLMINHNDKKSSGEAAGSKVIVIDPGHGGIDGGSSVSSNFLEKDINLDVALKLAKFLDEAGAVVILTREADVSLEGESDLKDSRYHRDLDARKDIINRGNADIYISIHTNCYRKDPSSRGAIIFYSKNSSKSEALSRSIAASIDEEVYSKYLGEPDLRTVISAARYYILRNTNIPGALIEVGFLSNQAENRLLHQEEYKAAMAQALCKGIIEYFKVEKDLHKSVNEYMIEISKYLFEQI